MHYHQNFIICYYANYIICFVYYLYIILLYINAILFQKTLFTMKNYFFIHEQVYLNCKTSAMITKLKLSFFCFKTVELSKFCILNFF